MNISEKGIALIKNFEGCRLEAYPDPATGGDPWSIGYGWTRPVDGVPVHKDMKITRNKAEQLLRCGLVSDEQAVNRLLKVPVSQNQFDALVSLAWNIGTRAFSTSLLLQKLNQGNYQGAAQQFLRWTWAGGESMPGLVRRRRAEQDYFLSAA